MKKILFLLGFILIGCINLFAQSRSSYDASFFKTDDQEAAIEVGRGINITDPFSAKRPCFTSASRDASLLKKQGSAGATTKIDVYYTKNEYEYNMFKSSNKSGSVSFLNIFNLSADELKQMTASKNQVSEKLIFVCTVDFGNYFYPDDPVFTPEAKALLDEGKYDSFKMRYGTHFVSGIGKGSSVIVELTLNSNEDQSESSNNFALDANLTYRADLNFKLNNTSEVNRKFSQRGFTVSITVHGPFITNDWENIIENMAQNNDLISSVSNFLKSQTLELKDETAALPIRYFLTDFTMYGCEGIKWNISKERKLSSINRNFLECSNIINMAQENIDKNPIKNPNTFINQYVNMLSRQESGVYDYDWVSDQANKLNPQWTSLITSAKELVEKLKNQYDNCSDISCGINETCCANFDYTDQVKSLFNQYNAIYKQLFSYVDQWYTSVKNKESQKMGKFTVVNKSSNPYSIYINGRYNTDIPGGYQTTWTMNLGTYQIKAVQKSGYLFEATVNNRTVRLQYEGQEETVYVGFLD